MFTPKKKKFQSAKNILMSSEFLDRREKSEKYITREFQDFGYRLAVHLNDMSHKSLYIKMAKNVDRNLLLHALSFARDYPKAKNKGRIFMWKLAELQKSQDQKAKVKNLEFKTTQKIEKGQLKFL